jgi:hypothetical protein
VFSPDNTPQTAACTSSRLSLLLRISHCSINLKNRRPFDLNEGWTLAGAAKFDPNPVSKKKHHRLR